MSLDVNASARYFPQTMLAADIPVQRPLSHSLALVDELFGIDRLIAESGRQFVDDYYRQSLPGYSRLYNRWQCMHVALHDETDTEEQAFFAQATEVDRHLTGAAGQRVLEIGCGLGANTLHLASRHPCAEFVGVDLMPAHVSSASTKARNLANASFRCASFQDLPDDLGRFDVILAVETLCYATDLDRVAGQIARHLRPGGRIIVFDAHRKCGFDSFPDDVVTAARLYEITTAVTRGFHPTGAWERAFARAGLDLTETDDVTRKTLTGLTNLNRRSMKAYTQLKWRVALKMMPRYLARNTVAGLLGYHVCFGDGARPDPDQGAVRYEKITAVKSRN